jgi:hypothetical protein
LYLCMFNLLIGYCSIQLKKLQMNRILMMYKLYILGFRSRIVLVFSLQKEVELVLCARLSRMQIKIKMIFTFSHNNEELHLMCKCMVDLYKLRLMVHLMFLFIIFICLGNPKLLYIHHHHAWLSPTYSPPQL